MQRTTTSEPLLAERVLARESKNEPRRRPVDRCYHRLESSDFLRNPPSPARLSVSCRECAALGVVHELFESSCLPEEQRLVRNHVCWPTDSIP